MKRFIIIFIITTLTSCSFDSKTGIWKDASNFPIENQDVISIESGDSKNRYEEVFTRDFIYSEEKNSLLNSSFEMDTPFQIENWLQKYGTESNNISNFSYSGNKTLVSKSLKVKGLSGIRDILFYNNNLISYNRKGKIFVYSLLLKKRIYEYNFYKKKFKKVNKNISFLINEDVLYASDNLGYLYAIDLVKKSLIWAKNYGIPFRSNLKFVNEQLFVANQDNVLYSINTKTGEKNWQYATSGTFLKSDFKNNIALDKNTNTLLFYNTSGELYSINYLSKKFNWVLNFKNSSSAGDTDLFISNPVILKNNNMIISTEKAVLSYNFLFVSKNWSFPSDSILKPFLTTNYTYIISKKNFLICLENKSGEVLWSKNIYKSLQNKKTKNLGNFIDIQIINSELNLFTDAGYLLSFSSKNGNLDFIKKISKNGINSEIFFSKNNFLLVDKKKRLLKFN